MNDSVKYMIAAGAIAGVCMGAGVVIGWKLAAVKNEEFKIKSEARRGAASSQPSAFSVFPTTRGTNTRYVVSRGTNVFAAGGKPGTGKQNGRLVTSSPTGGTSNPAYQKVQNEPEVIKARGELVAAQKRAADVMEKIMKEEYGDISFDAFQKIQNVPEVKQAREAAAEAQQRYFEVMKKAAEGRK